MHKCNQSKSCHTCDMAPGKTCADDDIVAEMLYHLEDDVLDVLAKAFVLRLLNHISEDDDRVWDNQCLNLIKKRADAKFIKDFRPIAIIPVFQKLYSKLFLSSSATK